QWLVVRARTGRQEASPVRLDNLHRKGYTNRAVRLASVLPVRGRTASLYLYGAVLLASCLPVWGRTTSHCQ
ncbi:hypothetical protein DPMN_069261, partial [Dreissena polymorpha]